jgi:hypothetical protein
MTTPASAKEVAAKLAAKRQLFLTANGDRKGMWITWPEYHSIAAAPEPSSAEVSR